jgi:hypothetical protein
MRSLKITAAVALLALSLAGCATGSFGAKVASVASALTGATVSPQAIIVLADSFDAVEVTAKNYISLPRCTGANGPVCRNPAATIAINSAIRSGRVARNNAKQFLRDHPGQLGTQGLYDALQTSIDTLKSIFAQYSVGT